jgi:hypothetical protein
VLEILNGMWAARAVQVAAELGIADLLVEGPRSVDELAEATGTHAPSLARLLRALSTFGIFAAAAPGVYAQTPRSACLAGNARGSLRNAARMFGADWQWRSWTAFPSTIRTGRPAFDEAHGVGLLEYVRSVDPDAGELFDAAMADMSSFLNRAVLDAYDFADARAITDVGGGHSTLLAEIVRAHPAVTGTLLDVPAVTARARALIDEAGVGDRCQVVEGDMFDAVPAGADVLLLNRVLHDWDDERALALLRSCRSATSPDGCVVIVEQLLDPEGEMRRAALLDLQMLQLRGGGERTADEYAALLGQAAFRVKRTLRTASPMCVVEACPV